MAVARRRLCKPRPFTSILVNRRKSGAGRSNPKVDPQEESAPAQFGQLYKVGAARDQYHMLWTCCNGH